MLAKFQEVESPSSNERRRTATQFPVVKYAGVDLRAIQFIRCRFKDGGAVAAQKSLEKGVPLPKCVEIVDKILIVFHDMKEFMLLLHRDESGGDDFSRLLVWLQTMKTAWRTTWNRILDPSIVILLLHQEVSATTSTEEDALIYDAIAFLEIMERVDCMICTNCLAMQEFLYRSMTIVISKAPYAKIETRYIPKLSCPLPRTLLQTKTGTMVNRKTQQIQETWYRMLCTLPQMSPARAAGVVQRYPTLRSLWRAYQDQNKTTQQKELLLAWILDENGGDRRHLRKLSTQIYHILMSFRSGEKIA